MIESTKKPSELMSDKAVDRLLADIEAATVDVYAGLRHLAEAATKIVGTDLVGGGLPTTDLRFSDGKFLWRIYAWPRAGASVMVDGDTIDDALAALAREVRFAAIMAETKARIEREVRDLMAADSATKHESNPVTGGPTIDPTAHMGGMLGGGFDGGDADLDAIDQRAAIAHAPKPDIASAKVIHRGSGANRNRYQWETSLTPTREEVIEAQTRLGFNPAGYGGPFNLKTEKVADCEYVTTWESDSSCD